MADRTEYKNQWARENLERVPLVVKKGQKAEIQAHAAAQGESVNGFIGRAIQEAMERDKAAAGPQRPQESPEKAPTAAQEKTAPLPHLLDGASTEDIAGELILAIDGIAFTVGEIGDLLLTLSLLGYGNEYHPTGGAEIKAETLGGCFSRLWEMVNSSKKSLDDLTNRAHESMKQAKERRRADD